MSKLDLSTIFGIFTTLILLYVAINISGNFIDFIDLPSIIIVILGTILVTIACFSLGEFFRSLRIIFSMVATHTADPVIIAKDLMKIAEKSYKNGILTLEKEADLTKKHGDFFNNTLQIIVDGTDVKQVTDIMDQDIISMQEDHRVMISLLKKAAEIAPSMGLIGTLIGLVQMLGSLDNVSAIGPAMAVALLTTFYGAVFAFVVLFPLASKLERNTEAIILNFRIYSKVLMSIAYKQNPRQLETLLNSVLPGGQKINYYNKS